MIKKMINATTIEKNSRVCSFFQFSFLLPPSCNELQKNKIIATHKNFFCFHLQQTWEEASWASVLRRLVKWSSFEHLLSTLTNLGPETIDFTVRREKYPKLCDLLSLKVFPF